MIKIENLEVWGFRGAFRGHRNAFNSHEKADSTFNDYSKLNWPVMGPNDVKTFNNAVQASKHSKSHAKFRRMIHVQADITAPLYWWKEYDTYKISTTANSESTMHTIMSRPFGIDQFAIDRMDDEAVENLLTTIDYLNKCRDRYLAANLIFAIEDDLPGTCYARTKQQAWDNVIQTLPTSWLQKRTIDINYETLAIMHIDRANHKLIEWREFDKYMTQNCPESWIFTGVDISKFVDTF